jgi:2-oxoacid:acceptor oxidoreductase gamma subunit (pyruvate/2-ketoisovalerate family)
MFEVRIHGRGGQGVVTAAEMLSIAAFEEGHHAQAFPSFGSERTGAPVVAFCRIADKEIRLREPIMQPDALIIQDPTLLHQIDVFAGLKKNGFILINTTNTFEELGLSDFVRDFPADRLCTLAATDWDSSTSAARCRTCRCSPASLRSPAHQARIRVHGDQRQVLGQGRAGQRRRRDRSVRDGSRSSRNCSQGGRHA